MPCNNLAVVRAEISADTVAELLASEAGISALAAHVTKLANSQATAERQRAYRHVGGDVDGYDAVWIRTASGVQVVLWDGKLTLQGPSKSELQAIEPGVREYADRLAGTLARERTIAALKAKYTVRGDTRDTTGARVLKLSI